MYEWMHSCTKRRKGRKILPKVVVPVVVRLGQALQPNQDNVMVHEPMIIDLFSIYVIIIPNMNSIMKDPIVKLTTFTWPVLKNHHRVMMVCTYIQQKNVTWWNDWPGLKNDRFRDHTNSEKSTLSLRVSFGARIESKSKNWNSHSFPINGMWLSKIGDSISRSMGMRINVGSEN